MTFRRQIQPYSGMRMRACACGKRAFARTHGRRAFTLVETVLALAIFVMAAFFISTTCYNLLFPLDMKERDVELENLMDRAVEAITSVSDEESLDDGVDVETLDGDTCTVYGEAEPTQVIDLFELKMRVEKEGKTISKTLWVIRPDWYENTNDRDELVRDRTDYLETLRLKQDFKR